jgi:hypothetical protein
LHGQPIRKLEVTMVLNTGMILLRILICIQSLRGRCAGGVQRPSESKCRARQLLPLARRTEVLLYRSSPGESAEDGHSFGLPCSSTTSDFEPGGKTCNDFRNSMTSPCFSGDNCSNFVRESSASP